MGTAAALVALTAAGLGSSESGDVAGTEGNRPEPAVKLLDPVEVVEIRPTDLSEGIALTGEVTPGVRTTVSAEVAGRIGQVLPRTGERVTAGEVLATIAPEDHRIAVQVRKAEAAALAARLRVAKSVLDRTRRLAERGAASDAVLEDAQRAVDELNAGVAVADAALRLTEVNLERATIRAPMSGVVASRSVDPGQFVQPGNALFEIIDLSSVVLESQVPIARAGALRTGQLAMLWRPWEPDRPIEARVGRIGPRAEPGTRSLKVYIDIDNAREDLRAGTFLSGRIETRSGGNLLALPHAAIRDDGGGPRVLAVRDGRTVLLPVRTGSRWHADDLVEITAGLNVGDVVVALPLAGLEPGDRVALAGE